MGKMEKRQANDLIHWDPRYHVRDQWLINGFRFKNRRYPVNFPFIHWSFLIIQQVTRQARPVKKGAKPPRKHWRLRVFGSTLVLGQWREGAVWSYGCIHMKLGAKYEQSFWKTSGLTPSFSAKKHATLVFSPSESIPGPWMDPRNGVFEPAQLDRCLWNYQTSWGCRKDFHCERVRVHHKPTKELVVTGSLVWRGRG